MKAKINGKEVDFSLTVGRKIYGKNNGQDLGDLENGPITQMFLDPEVFARAAWANYQDRLEAVGCQDEGEFFAMIDGENYRKMESAVKEAIKDFFPWGQKLVEKIEQRIETLGETIDHLAPSGQSSGSMPESLG